MVPLSGRRVSGGRFNLFDCFLFIRLSLRIDHVAFVGSGRARACACACARACAEHATRRVQSSVAGRRRDESEWSDRVIDRRAAGPARQRARVHHRATAQQGSSRLQRHEEVGKGRVPLRTSLGFSQSFATPGVVWTRRGG